MSLAENDSLVTSYNLTEVIVERFDPLLETEVAWFFTVVFMTFISFGILSQRSIFKLMKRRSDRGVNQIILSQQISMFMLIPFDAFAILNMFVYPVSSVVSEVGCYVIDFLQYYNVIVLQTTSFYTSLFRYLCVAHQPFLSKHGLTSKDLAKRLVIFQHFVAALFHLISRVVGTVDAGNGRNLLMCLGSYNEMFDSKLVHISCKGTDGVYPCWIMCQCLSFIVGITSSNLVEIFLLIRIVQMIEVQTKDIRSLLSPASFQKRQREDEIMFLVNLLQYCMEFVLTISFVIYLFAISSLSSVIMNKVWFVYSSIFYISLNAFYLLGDHTFQKNVRIEGYRKALWRALRQDYC